MMNRMNALRWWQLAEGCPMKKTTTTAGAITFSLADFPSGSRAKLEDQIIERALQLWRKKRRLGEKSKMKQ